MAATYSPYSSSYSSCRPELCVCVLAFKYQIHINFDIEAEIYLIAF